ncbi:MAG: hypothetical protein WC966_04815 [Bradymonadales bacterium]|jgi:chromosome segregation ATPase
MSMQTLAIILAIVLVGAIIWIFSLRKERNKYLEVYQPTKRERDRLQEEVESLNKKLEARDKPSQRDSKEDVKAKSETKDKKDSKKQSEDSAKLKEVKEENYRLKQDNKDLRRSLKERDSADSDVQKDLIAARETASDLQRELDAAQTRLRLLEREAAQRSADDVRPKDAQAEAEQNGELENKLRSDIDHIHEKWRATREELDSLKKSFRDDVQSAKQEFIEANKAVRRELGQAKRLLAQSKKRADNNHRIFLIARSQLLLAEQQLMAIDPSYKPILPLATSDSGIEDKLNKFVTQTARHDKAVEEAAKSEARVRELEALLRERGIEPTTAGAVASDEIQEKVLASIDLDDELSGLDDGWDLDDL